MFVHAWGGAEGRKRPQRNIRLAPNFKLIGKQSMLRQLSSKPTQNPKQNHIPITKEGGRRSGAPFTNHSAHHRHWHQVYN